MGRILKLVIAVAILYFGVTRGLPWLKSQFGEKLGPSGDTNQAICYNAAERAAEGFSERIRGFSKPPIDPAAWEEMVSTSRNQVEAGERECRNCDQEACLEASRALAGLESLISEIDQSVQAGRGVPADSAGRLDRIYDTLSRSRSYL